MSRQRALQSAAAPAEQSHRRSHRVYTVAQLLIELEMPRSTFFHLRKKGLLPFLVEVKPRLGHLVRYRADLVDRYTSGQWQQPRAFRSHATHSAVRRASTVSPQFGQKGI